MKRKKYIGVLGWLLIIALVLGLAVLSVGANPPEVTFLNPLGQVVPVVNQPLAARLGDLNGKTIRMLRHGAATTTSGLFMDQLRSSLNAAGATAMAVADFGGTLFDGRTAAQYNTWASGVDAVIIGVLEDNESAWWAGYHARELEARGVPVVVITPDWCFATVKAGAQDNGIAALRIVTIPNSPWADAQGFAATAAARGTYLAGNIVGGTINISADVATALTGSLTAAELSAAPLTVADMGIPYADGRQFLTVSGNDPIEAIPAFYDLSMALGFGDGLPLVIPTQEAVDEMIAAVGREADEILGKVMLRGGIMTVGNVAANAVMAGARPEHFPVVLAVMEAYANGWEDNKLFYREVMSNSQRTLAMIVSGPIVGTEEGQLDLSRGRMLDPGKDDSAVIGRAVLLAIRNIGHIAYEYSNILGAESRIAPFELVVLAEANEYLPDGWVTLSEHMGFGDGSNTVTLLSITQSRYTSGVGGTAAGGYAGTFDNLTTHRTQANATNLNTSPGIFIVHWRDALYAAMTDTRARVDGGFSTAARGISSKEALQRWLAGTGGTPTENGTSPVAPTRSPNREALVWPIVAGYGHSTQGRVFHAASADYANSRGFHTQRIGGDTAPSTPQDFEITYKSEFGTSTTLSWSAPARGDVVSYEVSKDDGKTWLDVGLAETYTFDGLTNGQQYYFAVRARSDVVNSADVRAPGVNGPAAYVDFASSGRGAWAYQAAKALPATPAITLSGPSKVGYPNDTAVYTVSIDYLPSTAIWFKFKLTIDGAYFNELATSVESDFLSPFGYAWDSAGGTKMEATFQLTRSPGAYGDFDVLNLTLGFQNHPSFGTFPVADILTLVELDVLEFGSSGPWLPYVVVDDVVETTITQWYSVFDANKDGTIDGRDVAFAMIYYMMTDDDPNWDEFAAMCDLNGDGRVDVIDLVLIYANFT